MAYSALLPFLVLFVSFVFLRMSLTYASFVALLVCTLFSQTLFHMTPEMWNAAMLHTAEFLVEIGLILLGAFYFIEVAQETKVIDSLAQLVREVSPNRIVQGILVTFPLELMVEGSSGFGTPLLIIAPILLALDFPILLCAILPFINMINGIPFGALGTPIRLGFADASMNLPHETATYLLPFAFIGPLLVYFLIYHFDHSKKVHQAKHGRLLSWVVFLGCVYTLVNQLISKMGPEFPALLSGFTTFMVGVITARAWFKPEVKSPLKNKLGVVVYGLLLLTLFIGKRIWMDQTFAGTHIRIFNPGWIFILFAIGLSFFFKAESPVYHFRMALLRARRSLFVFFCMTFMVQQLRQNGATDLLTSHLPDFFLGRGAPILGWLGSMAIGTSTVSSLFFSKVVDPAHWAALSAGTSIGVQLAFQSLAGTRGILNDRISEKKILSFIAPISIGFVLILSLITL